MDHRLLTPLFSSSSSSESHLCTPTPQQGLTPAGLRTELPLLIHTGGGAKTPFRGGGKRGRQEERGAPQPALGHSPRVGRTRHRSTPLGSPGSTSLCLRGTHATHFSRQAGPGGAGPGKPRPQTAPGPPPESWSVCASAGRGRVGGRVGLGPRFLAPKVGNRSEP